MAALIWLFLREEQQEVPVEFLSRPADRQPVFTPTGHRPTPLSTPAISVGESDRLPAIAKVLFSQTPESVSLCPECGRKFGPQVAICPFDSTPLKSAVATRSVQQEGDRQQCPECDRTFEFPAKYCYVHGASLKPETEVVRIYWACQACGAEGDQRETKCSCDPQHHVQINPLDSTVSVPTIPMSRCGVCQHIGPQTQRICPHDGNPMEPVWDMKFRVMPTTGFGPRRAVCSECGTTYSSAATFCAFDGHALTPLN
jgi:hypothetical protein